MKSKSGENILALKQATQIIMYIEYISGTCNQRVQLGDTFQAIIPRGFFLQKRRYLFWYLFNISGKFFLYDAIHQFTVCLGYSSTPAYNNRFKAILEKTFHHILIVILNQESVKKMIKVPSQIMTPPSRVKTASIGF